MRHLTGYTNNPMEMRILRTFSPWAKMRLECGIYGVPQHTPMEMRILEHFSKKDAKSRQEAPGTPAEKINFYRKL